MRKFSEPTTTVRIKKSLHAEVKAFIENEDRSLRSLIELLLIRYMDRPVRLTRKSTGEF